MAYIADQIHVTTHVGRDLLQSAGVFKHERTVVWEYVANGLEYVDPGTNPVVKVRIDDKKKRIMALSEQIDLRREGQCQSKIA